MSTHARPAPVRAPFLTRGTTGVLAVAAFGIGVYLARLALGLRAVTHLSDQYPWGIWIAVDVATGVALAAGGFTSAALVYVFHREKYHALVRPALLTAMLGYTFVVIGLLADLGRYYNVWHPMLPSMWQGNSVLFEVGICVMIYLSVLYIEFLPLAVERFKGRVALPGPWAALNRPLEGLLGFLDRTLSRFIFVFIIAGVVLSCLHQSSLGSLMLIAPTKVHPLWYTPILPLLFLLSAISVGFPMVIFESLLAARSLRLKPELPLLSSLARMVPGLLGLYLAAKLIDITLRGRWPLVVAGTPQSIMWLIEVIGGWVVPLVLLSIPRVRRSATGLLTAAFMVVLGVALNRIDVFLVAYKPLYAQHAYTPSAWEVGVTAGLIATLVLVYRAMVMIFPVISAEAAAKTPALAPARAVEAELAESPDQEQVASSW